MALDHPQRLTDVLLQIGLVDVAGLQRAVNLVQQTGHRLLNVLVESGLVEESRLVRALGQALGIETVELSSIQINARVLARLPGMTALTLGVLPLAAKRANGLEYLYVAMADPLDSRAAEEICKVTGCRLSVLVAAPTQLERMLNLHYGQPTAAPPLSSAMSAPTPPAIIGKPVQPLGIEDYQASIRHTQLDPEISDIIITPAFDVGVEVLPTADEPEAATDTGTNAIANAGLNFPAGLNQAWDDGKTLDVDIDEFQQAQLQPSAASSMIVSQESALPSSVSLAMAMELPVSLTDDPSPFDGLGPVNIPAGLERTGIIPLSDITGDEFLPPPVEDDEHQDPNELAGIGDIPESPKEVQVRANEGGSLPAKAVSSSPPKAASSSPPPLPKPVIPKLAATEPAAKLHSRRVEEAGIPLAPSSSPPSSSPPSSSPPSSSPPSSPSSSPSSPPPLGFASPSPIFPGTKPSLSPPPVDLPLQAAPAADAPRSRPAPSLDAAPILDPDPAHQQFSGLSDAEIEPTDNGEAADLVRALKKGDSLNSAERAQLILALGRTLLDKGMITEVELVANLALSSLDD
jgi:hypothetical protein